MNLSYALYPSMVGRLVLVASQKGLRAVLWERKHDDRARIGDMVKNPDHHILKRSAHELDEYFAKKRTKFSVPLDPVGTDFQLRAWQALRKIPYGQTRSYGEQAHMIGNSKASRAVGAANGKNPISIIVPCHRVIGASGHLTGFGGGLALKETLLKLEGALT